MSPITTVLFDLDGTLLDTAPDMTEALNALRRKRRMDDLAVEIVKPIAGHGSRAMLKLALDIDHEHSDYPATQDEFFQAYENCIAHQTQLFPGMLEVLAHLEEQNITWGIVTNRPTRFTHTLLDALDLSSRTACVVCGDTLAQCKPHPATILHACDLLQRAPSSTLYVGDAATDIIASKAAGVTSLAALYGYIGAHEDPQSWQADGYIKSPADIIAWLKLR